VREDMAQTLNKYRDVRFQEETVERDGTSLDGCTFENCLVMVDKGETVLDNCSLKGCRFMLRGNAYTIGKIISLFPHGKPLRVLDFEEPGPWSKDRSSEEASQA